MSVKIQVTDSSGKPVKNAEVFIKWYSGYSKYHTDQSGFADTGVSSGGTIEYIQVWGKKVRGKMVVSGDDFLEITY